MRLQFLVLPTTHMKLSSAVAPQFRPAVRFNGHIKLQKNARFGVCLINRRKRHRCISRRQWFAHGFLAEIPAQYDPLVVLLHHYYIGATFDLLVQPLKGVSRANLSMMLFREIKSEMCWKNRSRSLEHTHTNAQPGLPAGLS